MLEYLSPFEKYCDINELKKIKIEREERAENNYGFKYDPIFENLPNIKVSSLDLSKSEVTIGVESDLTAEDKLLLEEKLKMFIPWRKGPYNFFGIDIDAEWRSDLKWNRIKDHIMPLKNRTILDIGCSNGYFLFRMAQSSPKLALGIDPVPHCFKQFNFIQKFANIPNIQFELWGVEHLKYFKNMFDVIFSMGIIYHHRHPIQQLMDILNALRPGGEALIETIGIPGDDSYALFPEDRYANMRNVWFIPTLPCLISWAKKAQFIDIEVVSNTKLTNEEQRLTKWCPPPHQSLDDFLDKDNSNKTLEGFPAPIRFSILARKKR